LFPFAGKPGLRLEKTRRAAGGGLPVYILQSSLPEAFEADAALATGLRRPGPGNQIASSVFLTLGNAINRGSD
jgi:hypothetical protein